MHGVHDTPNPIWILKTTNNEPHVVHKQHNLNAVQKSSTLSGIMSYFARNVSDAKRGAGLWGDARQKPYPCARGAPHFQI